MKTPATPSNESERLAILDELAIVYSPAEERYDRITRLARRIFDVPIALISLVTANTQWFKSNQGLVSRETDRKISFCGHAILRNDALIIPDTLKDSDFADNPLVLGEPYIRFYAGHPIQLNSVKLGTFCIIDQRPRRFRNSDYDTLKSLALWVETELKFSLYSESQKELLEKVKVLQRKSLVDPLTGCWNQRGVDKLITSELSRSQRNNKPISFMIVDLEKFKKVDIDLLSNTKNMLLKDIAQRIRQSVRSHDHVGKIGETQFFVCLIDCSKDTAEILTQRVLRNLTIERYNTNEGKLILSASIGYTSNEQTDIWSATLLMDTVNMALTKAINSKKDNSIYYVAPNRC